MRAPRSGSRLSTDGRRAYAGDVENDRLPAALERQPHTFSSRAVDVLRTMVLQGQLASGERLNEVELAAALGISRGPLREAIQRLRSEGLLTAVSGRGAFVRTFTPDGLRDLYEVRVALEGHAVRIAANVASRAAIAELRAMVERTGEALTVCSPGPDALEFHQQVVALTGNSALIEAATEAHRQVSLVRARSGHVSGRAREALAEHRAVLDRMAVGDGDGAAALMTEHLRLSLQSALGAFPVVA